MTQEKPGPLVFKVMSGIQKGAVIFIEDNVPLTIGSSREAHAVLRGNNIPLIALEIILKNGSISVLHADSNVYWGEEPIVENMILKMLSPITIGDITIAYGFLDKEWELSPPPSSNEQDMVEEEEESSTTVPIKIFLVSAGKMFMQGIFSDVNKKMRDIWVLVKPHVMKIVLPIVRLYHAFLALRFVQWFLPYIRRVAHIILVGLRYALWVPLSYCLRYILSNFLLIFRTVKSFVVKLFVLLIFNPLWFLAFFCFLPFLILKKYLALIFQKAKTILSIGYHGIMHSRVTKLLTLVAIILVISVPTVIEKRDIIFAKPVVIAPNIILEEALRENVVFSPLRVSYQDFTKETLVILGTLKDNKDIYALRRFIQTLEYGSLNNVEILTKVNSKENIENSLFFLEERIPGLLETEIIPLGDSTVRLTVKGVVDTSFLYANDLTAIIKNEIPSIVDVSLDIIGTEEMQKKSHLFLQNQHPLRFVTSKISQYNLVFSGAILGNYLSYWERSYDEFINQLPNKSFARSTVHIGPSLNINVQSYITGNKAFMRFFKEDTKQSVRASPGDFITRNMVIKDVTKNGLILQEADFHYFYFIHREEGTGMLQKS